MRREEIKVKIDHIKDERMKRKSQWTHSIKGEQENKVRPLYIEWEDKF
jgi:hypothetical protein